MKHKFIHSLFVSFLIFEMTLSFSSCTSHRGSSTDTDIDADTSSYTNFKEVSISNISDNHEDSSLDISDNSEDSSLEYSDNSDYSSLEFSDNSEGSSLEFSDNSGGSSLEFSDNNEGSSLEISDNNAFTIQLCFAGDINLDENWETTKYLDQQSNGIYDCISPELITYMREADLMCLNNEFTYSTKGSPLSGKAYTFRADPSRVFLLQEMGVDLVTLANNHIYDYGKEALLDTFSTLNEANIPYFGAGRNLSEASSPYYIEVESKTIAFVGASRAEKNKMTPQATETEPGILRCYDTTLVVESIKEAKENADYVIVFVHWGTEYSDVLEPVQIEDAHLFIDSGADAIIGAHSHCLQGFEYYDGKPIVYSLGNYWFNGKTLNTMLINLTYSGDNSKEEIHLSMVPAIQQNCTTTYIADYEKQRALYDYMESISIHVSIDDNGVITETQ